LFNLIDKTVKVIKEPRINVRKADCRQWVKSCGAVLCVSCNIVLLLIVSPPCVNKGITRKRTAHTTDSEYFIFPYQIAELSKTTAHTDEEVGIINKEFKVPSQTVNAINNKTGRLTKEEEIIYDSENDNGTDVKLLTTKQ
jgi:hypothetical protein